MSEGYYPQWLVDRAVPDDVFGEAYANLIGPRRAWVKKTIAQVHAMAAPMRGPVLEHLEVHRQGFASRRRSIPLDSAVLFLDDTCTSAPMAVAAAVPMLMAGVAHVCAVRVTEEDSGPDDVLAGLELAGVETVFQLGEAEARKFLEFLVAGGSAAVLFHGQGALLDQLRTAAGYAAPPLRIWKPFAVERVGVFAGSGTQWDWELLSWVHGCSFIEVYGARTASSGLPAGCRRVAGGFEALLAGRYSVLYVPEDRQAEAAGAANLVLAPGQEGCWAWPGLNPELFRIESLALCDSPC